MLKVNNTVFCPKYFNETVYVFNLLAEHETLHFETDMKPVQAIHAFFKTIFEKTVDIEIIKDDNGEYVRMIKDSDYNIILETAYKAPRINMSLFERFFPYEYKSFYKAEFYYNCKLKCFDENDNVQVICANSNEIQEALEKLESVTGFITKSYVIEKE